MEVTTDKIIETLSGWIADKTPIDPQTWLDAAAKLNVLSLEERNKLFTLQHKLAGYRANLLEQGKSVAQARTMVEANPEYLEAQKQKGKLEVIIEMVRIAKQQSRAAGEEYHSRV